MGQEHEAFHPDSGEGQSGAESELEHPKGHSAEYFRTASAETGADDDDLDSMSDATDCSDISHVEALPQGARQSGLRSWETYEDRVQAIIDRLASRMREYPLMPPDVSDPTAEETYRDMDSCVRLPLLHCAFKGCSCNVSRRIYCTKLYHWQLEIEIYEHVVKEHPTEMEEVMDWIERKDGSGDLFLDEVDVLFLHCRSDAARA